MILRYYGHDFFTLTLAEGAVIATDPYSGLYDYPERAVPADICTISHAHYDHNSVQILQGHPTLIDTAGVHQPKAGIRITGIPSHHDDCAGQKRGPNLIFVIETDGLRLVHLGDLGHPLTPSQISAIGKPDLLFLPVGGYYTIDAQTALDVMQSLRPTVTIPMHYQTSACLSMPIAPVSAFLSLAGVSPKPLSLCRITAEDLSQRPPLLLMTTPEGFSKEG